MGKTDIELDPKTLSRILEVSRFSEQDREHILYTLDAMIKSVKLKSL